MVRRFLSSNAQDFIEDQRSPTAILSNVDRFLSSNAQDFIEEPPDKTV